MILGILLHLSVHLSFPTPCVKWRKWYLFHRIDVRIINNIGNWNTYNKVLDNYLLKDAANKPSLIQLSIVYRFVTKKALLVVKSYCF